MSPTIVRLCGLAISALGVAGRSLFTPLLPAQSRTRGQEGRGAPRAVPWEEKSRGIGNVAILAALAVSLIGARMALGAIGQGCSDADVLQQPGGGYRIVCSGACPNGDPCVVWEVVSPDGTWSQSCVCDPTPVAGHQTGGMSNQSGDEYSDIDNSSCHTTLLAVPRPGGMVSYQISCNTVNCASTCVAADDGQVPPGAAWCDCP